MILPEYTGVPLQCHAPNEGFAARERPMSPAHPTEEGIGQMGDYRATAQAMPRPCGT